MKFLLLVLNVLLFPFFASEADSAEIRALFGEKCRVSITGEISRGDAARLKDAADHLLVFDGESTSASVLCLNSPGGSVIEGLEISRFILNEGISTYIGDGATCASICAIMFMMGNYRGDEVAGLSRTMHYRANLGFHRPYIEANEARSYSSSDLESVYALGLETVLDILGLANKREPWGTSRMIEPELMARMIGTPGSEMFYIKSLEEVERWRISLDGLPDRLPGAKKAQYACENVLAYPVGLPSQINRGFEAFDRRVFGFESIQSHIVSRLASAPRAFVGKVEDVGSVRAGYAGVGCTVAVRGKSVGVCGYDQTTDTYVGMCGINPDMRYFSHTALLHPANEISTLGVPDKLSSDVRRFTSCEVFDSSYRSIEKQYCLQSVMFVVENGEALIRHIFDWPSNSRTVIDIQARKYNEVGNIRINGSAGQRIGIQILHHCVLNESTGNSFCIPV